MTESQIQIIQAAPTPIDAFLALWAAERPEPEVRRRQPGRRLVLDCLSKLMRPVGPRAT